MHLEIIYLFILHPNINICPILSPLVEKHGVNWSWLTESTPNLEENGFWTLRWNSYLFLDFLNFSCVSLGLPFKVWLYFWAFVGIKWTDLDLFKELFKDFFLEDLKDSWQKRRNTQREVQPGDAVKLHIVDRVIPLAIPTAGRPSLRWESAFLPVFLFVCLFFFEFVNGLCSISVSTSHQM